ncbi:hypothetical protein ACJMK2_008860 [Sinanodonta woodiana]|uniref:NIPSNAP domain-containing protein n=1 Tax=Sinanodonta woodiana TaxID=1069815 RepID=A0ABD3VCA3_SINWO
MSANLCNRFLRSNIAIFILSATRKSIYSSKWFACTTTNFSTNPSETSAGKVYELRCYSIIPKDMKHFLELSEKWMHLRTVHSKCIGYWTSEIGGINDVVHIWEYDNLSHRASVRQTLAKDPDWIQNYFSKILPLLSRQQNSLLRLVPGSDLITKTSKGVYELQQFNLPGSPSPDQISQALSACTQQNATLLGTFYSIIGTLSSAYQLWRHPDVDNLITGTGSEHSAGKKECINASRHSRLLLPTPWSMLK